MSLLNELVGAINERRAAVGLSALPEISEGHPVVDLAFWRGLQDGLEACVTSYVDHGAAIDGEAAIPFFTLSTWRAAAGLTGFRAYTTHPAESGSPEYRAITAGDILDGWIISDLRAGCVALKWTVADATVDGTLVNEDGSGADAGAAESDAEANQTTSDSSSIGAFARVFEDPLAAWVATRSASSGSVAPDFSFTPGPDYGYDILIKGVGGYSVYIGDDYGIAEDEWTVITGHSVSLGLPGWPSPSDSHGFDTELKCLIKWSFTNP